MGQQAEFSNTAKHVTWTIKKFQGNTEQTIRVKVRFVRRLLPLMPLGWACGSKPPSRSLIYFQQHQDPPTSPNPATLPLEQITLSDPATTNTRKEIGPISLNFEVPMYNVSNLAVRYLRIAEQGKAYNPYRWVRYVTQSNSYVCRI